MRIHSLLLVLSLAGPALLAAQGSPFVALDDPDLALVEHLIVRGTIADPTPFVRPFTREAAVRVLRGARPSADSAIIRRLLARWTPTDSAGWFAVEVRAGAQSFSAARTDPLRPEGLGATRPYGDLLGIAVLGPITMVTRPATETRITLDPDWPGQRVSDELICCRWRFPEAYLAYQQGPLRVQYGQLARNWGPVGIAGIAMSDVAYPRNDLAIEVRGRDLHLLSTVAQLRDVDIADGGVIRRYHVASRLGLRLGEAWHVAAWQTAVLEGDGREVEGPFRNPLLLLPLANQFGDGDRDNNVMMGLQLRWRHRRGLQLEGEVALDDFIQQNRENFPDRWAATLVASGPGPAGTSWRALYTRASSLAFRTSDPNEGYTERGIGLGRGWADGDLAMASVARPLTDGFLVGLEAAAFRRGEGRLDDPIPPTRPIPGIFIGTRERTLRLAATARGRVGPLDLQGDAGINRTTNPGNVAGPTETAFQGRLTALLRIGTQGTLR